MPFSQDSGTPALPTAPFMSASRLHEVLVYSEYLFQQQREECLSANGVEEFRGTTLLAIEELEKAAMGSLPCVCLCCKSASGLEACFRELPAT